jgi:hypothetical protein
MKSIVLSLVFVSLFVRGASPSSRVTSISQAVSAPIIDGMLNDPCWKQTKPILVIYPHDGSGKAPDPVPMTTWMTWDSHYLYLAYEVNDTNLVALGTGRKTGPPKNRRPQSLEYAPEKNLDLAEFFISLGNGQFFWEIHHNAANHLNTLWIEVPSPDQLVKIEKPVYRHVTFHRNHYLPDQGTHTLKRAVQLKKKANNQPSILNLSTDRDTGYTGELRLPWAGLLFNQPPKKVRSQLKDLKLSLLAVNLNGNRGKAAYYSSGSGIPKLMYHFSSHKWPVYRLVD